MKTPFSSKIVKSKYKKYVDETGLKLSDNQEAELKPKEAAEVVDRELPDIPEVPDPELEQAFNSVFEEQGAPGAELSEAEKQALQGELQEAGAEEAGPEEINLEELDGLPSQDMSEAAVTVAPPAEEASVAPVEIAETPVVATKEVLPEPVIETKPVVEPVAVAQEIESPIAPVAPELPVAPVASQPAKPTAQPVIVEAHSGDFVSVPDMVNTIKDKTERKEFNPAIISLEARHKKQKGGMTLADLNVYLTVSRQAHKDDSTKWENSASWLRELARLRKKKNNKIQDADPLTESALVEEMAARMAADKPA